MLKGEIGIDGHREVEADLLRGVHKVYVVHVVRTSGNEKSDLNTEAVVAVYLDVGEVVFELNSWVEVEVVVGAQVVVMRVVDLVFGIGRGAIGSSEVMVTDTATTIGMVDCHVVRMVEVMAETEVDFVRQLQKGHLAVGA